MSTDFDNVVSVDEFINYFFEFAFKPDFDEDRILASGMATDDQVREALHDFYTGWEYGTNLNPTEAEIIPELLNRYHGITNARRPQ